MVIAGVGYTSSAAAKEEVLRYDAPSPAAVRVVTQDMEPEGRTLHRGERAFPIIAAANRDPAVSANMERFDVSRQENPHIAFGVGVHFWLGAPLARMAGQIAIGAIMSRLRNPRLLQTEPEWEARLILRGVKALPLAFDAVPTQSAAAR